MTRYSSDWPGHAELHPRHRLGPHLERDQTRMVDEHPVPAVGQVERHILVRLLAAGAAVGVPDVDHLAVLHQRTEPLTQAVHDLANSQTELLADIVPVLDRAIALRRCGQHVPSARNSRPNLAAPTGERAPEVIVAWLSSTSVRTRTEGSVFSGNCGWRGRSPRKWLTATEMTSGAGDEHRTVSSGWLRVSPRCSILWVGA